MGDDVLQTGNQETGQGEAPASGLVSCRVLGPRPIVLLGIRPSAGASPSREVPAGLSHMSVRRAGQSLDRFRPARRPSGQTIFSSSRASATPGAGRPYSLAVTRARATSCRQRKAGRVEANSSRTVR